MRIKYRQEHSDKVREADLAEILTRDLCYSSHSTQVDQAANVAEKTAVAVGNLADLLVDKGILSLDEVWAAFPLLGIVLV
jgi:hypothetical protein